MLEVYFESDKEVLMFCEHLFEKDKEIELHWKIHEVWGNQLRINNSLTKDKRLDLIAYSMTEVFIAHRLGSLIKYIISNNYYYSDLDEIERIHELANWIFSSNDPDSVYVRKGVDLKQVVHSMFYKNLEDREIIHYDSIVKFGLKSFKDEMVHYVGLAIDEYKREEEHQEFINVLRNYVSKKEPGIPIIHIIQGKSFSFYLDNGQRLSSIDLKNLMEKEPLYLFGLDGNEMNLAPLIAMTPNQIKIYGEDPSEPKTQTIINIFQEKVEFKSIRTFPFNRFKKEQ